jgi:hypothetical protein
MMKHVPGWMWFVMVLILLSVGAMLMSSVAVGQDTAPTWEYAILVYGNDDAHVFTGNTETDDALTGLLVPQDSDASNIALALNVMGNDGWEMVDIIPAASSLYMFKRPKD